jgi:hypothetical protein
MSTPPLIAHKRGLGPNQHRPIILGNDWNGHVVIKVKGFRALALNGLRTYSLQGVDVPHALGVIEVVGSRSGQYSTSLWIGFSREAQLPDPGFRVEAGEAVGTLVVPDTCFTPWLEILKSPQAHFRIGDDGQGNALASDPSLLEEPI